MKRLGLILAAVLLIAILIGAAFVGGRLLTNVQQTAEAGGGGRTMMIQANNGSGPVSVKLKIKPAPELPDRAAEANGVYVKRQDNSFFVGTGNIRLAVEVDGHTGKRDVSATSDGPQVEVVVGRDTIIYRDDTDFSLENAGSMSSGEKTIQQVIKPTDSLDEIAKNTELQVWGERRGDRVIAQILVYRIIKG
ncbi:MAG: hypothetical protein EXR62_02670 [Chloroflexi bacterium]|nr:hypothetical protein [Chloroflexota bacterium]